MPAYSSQVGEDRAIFGLEQVTEVSLHKATSFEDFGEGLDSGIIVEWKLN